MSHTPYPDIDVILEDLLERLQEVLAPELAGVYLSGSLVWGDFDKTISDLDLLAVLSSEADTITFSALERMHSDFALKHPDWFDRIEVHYVLNMTLRHPLKPSGKMLVISPGEPLNKKPGTKHYLMNWYLVQEQSVTLYGPEPKSLIAAISQEVYFENVKLHANSWQTWIAEQSHIKAQSYAILTMCRAMYSLKFAKQSSKKQAAQWAQKTYPQWTKLIQDALEWRRVPNEDCPENATMLDESKAFVAFALKEMNA